VGRGIPRYVLRWLTCRLSRRWAEGAAAKTPDLNTVFGGMMSTHRAPSRLATEMPPVAEKTAFPEVAEHDETLPVAATPTGGRARMFRVFVSSTFDDFKVEREVLRRDVWPRLRELCASYGARFQAIDLRWGISEEAAADQQTMNICLGEIERCRRVTPRPNFLVLLGNHYGWRPPPPEIPESEYCQITGHLAADDRGLVEKWYERDNNAVPQPEFRLRQRTGRYLDPDQWRQEEARLSGALWAGVEGLGLPEPRRRRYVASATEQEIAAGALAGDPDEAVCFVREIDGYPQVGVTGETHFVDGDQRPLTALKDAVRRHLGGERIAEGSVPWGADGPVFSQEYQRGFADDVYEALAQSIRDELAHPKEVQVQAGRGGGDALDEEIDAHRGFAAKRCEFFTGRADELARIDDYLAAEEPRPLVVYGAGGIGKSAVMAKALGPADGRPDGVTVVARFIGATPGSSDVRMLLAGMCQELARRARDPENEVPTDYAELVPDFARRLERAAALGPVLAFIDSLDQLRGARSLAWVPQPLPAGVRMALSTRPGDTLDPLIARGAGQLELRGLPATDGAELLDKWLGAAHRQLQDPQRRAVLTGFELSGGNPLYLRLAFGEARRWTSADGRPPEELAVGVRALIRDNLLVRLASEDNHGERLVSHALGYLAASRDGLAEDELTDLLSRDPVLYWWFLLGSHHLPSDLLSSAEAYPLRPAGQDPAAWLRSLVEAARILEEQPWQLHCLLGVGRGRTVTQLAEQAGLHPARAQRILTDLSADRLASADEDGRWTATEPSIATGTADSDPKLAWARAYRDRCAGTGWRFPDLDCSDGEVGEDADLVAQRWLGKLEQWRDELEAFLGAVVPARIAKDNMSDRLVARPKPGPELPDVFWSRLSFDLAPYLTERWAQGSDLLAFYHSELRDVSAEAYAAGDDGRALHRRLADYFGAEADPRGDESWTTKDNRHHVRGLSELPYHLTQGQEWDGVEQTLTDLTFMAAKTQAGMVHGLLEDLKRPEATHSLPGVALARQAVSQSLAALISAPDLARQTLYNRLAWADPAGSSLLGNLETARRILDSQPWLRAAAPLPESAATAVPFSTPSVLQSLSADGNAIAVATDLGEVHVYDLATGAPVDSRQLRSANLTAIALCEHPQRLAWMTMDGTIRSDEGLRALEGRAGESTLLYHPEGGIIAVRSDNALVVWRPASGHTDILISDVPAPVTSLHFSAEGDHAVFAAGGQDTTIGYLAWDGSRWTSHRVPYTGPPVRDLDYNAEHDALIVVRKDRCASVLEPRVGAVIASTYYERTSKNTITGAPARCVCGPSSTKAFIATEQGGLAIWDWSANTIERLEDAYHYTDPHRLVTLAYPHATGMAFYTTERGVQSITQVRQATGLVRHRGEVLDCFITASGEVISAGKQDDQLCWSSVDGLHLLAARIHSGITCVSPCGASSDALIGTASGWVWAQPAHRDVDASEIDHAFESAVQDAFLMEPNVAVVADRSGRVLRDQIVDAKVQRLCASGGVEELLKILPAHDAGLFLALRRELVGDANWTLTLHNASGQGEEIFRSRARIWDVAISSDGQVICLATDDGVQVLRRGSRGWRLTGSLTVMARHISFAEADEHNPGAATFRPTGKDQLSGTAHEPARNGPVSRPAQASGKYLATAQVGDRPWLEIWDVQGDRTTGVVGVRKAAADLPGTVTCLATAANALAVGFASGQLASFYYENGRCGTGAQCMDARMKSPHHDSAQPERLFVSR
jgi:WD40 repeat protein